MNACSDTTFVLSRHVSPSCFVSMFRLLFRLHISSASLLDVSPTFDLQVLCQRFSHVFSQRFTHVSLTLCLHVSRNCHCRFVSTFHARVIVALSQRFVSAFCLCSYLAVAFTIRFFFTFHPHVSCHMAEQLNSQSFLCARWPQWSPHSSLVWNRHQMTPARGNHSLPGLSPPLRTATTHF